MKRILSIFVCFQFFTPIFAQKSEVECKLEKLNLKLIENSFNEHGEKKDIETKVLRVNRFEYFISEEKEADAIALSYLQERCEIYGICNDLNNIKKLHTAKTPSGKYVYYQQYINEIPVFATNFIVFINNENVVKYALNEFRNISKYEKYCSSPLIEAIEAIEIAHEYLNVIGDIIGEIKSELVYFESTDYGLKLTWKINILPMMPFGDWQLFVSSDDGTVIHAEDMSINADGNGWVFIPNPLVSANVPYGYNGCYQHNNGTTNSCLDSQLVQVILKDIFYDRFTKKYKLKGPYCKIEDIMPPLGHTIPELSTSDFYFTRDQVEFEAVMCYYHVDLSARRILQLGYEIPDGLLEFRADPHGMSGMPNAAYFPNGNFIQFGGGGTWVNFAEDADVIRHEYAHAMQNKLTPTGILSSSDETASIMEGSSDYWATTYKRHLFPNNWVDLGSWAEMGFPGRRADLDLVYPDDYDFNAPNHTNGQIWSSVLMKIWSDLGRDITDQLFLETHFIWGQSLYMRDAAADFIQADLNLYNGIHLCEITDRFTKCGLIDNSSITISQNTTWNTDKFIFGNVIIPNGVTLTITSVIKFDKNFKIIVQPGGSLVVNGGTLTNICDENLWQGVVLEGATTTPQNAGTQGSIVLTNAVIENALIAIDAAPVSNPANGYGGIIQATNTEFINNLQSINYGHYENKNSNGDIIDNIGKFTKCIFSINQDNCFSANGLTFSQHVKLNLVRGIKFLGCRFDNMANTGGKGIFAEDAGFTVTPFCTKKMPAGTDCECPENYSTPCIFENLHYGINSNNSGNQYDIVVDQSNFNNNNISVEMNVSNHYQLTRCDIKNIKHIGLRSSGSSGYRIEENSFFALSPNSMYPYNTGIEITNSGTAENKIYKNKFEKLYNGIWAFGTNGTNRAPYPGLQFLCNIFYYNGFDINVAQNSILRLNQGSTGAGADNSFFNTSLSSFNNSPTNLSLSYFFYIFPYYRPFNHLNINLFNANPNQCGSTFCLNNSKSGTEATQDNLNTYLEMQNELDNLVILFEKLGYSNVLENIENGEFSEELIMEALLFLSQIDIISNTMRELSDNSIRTILQDSILDIEYLKSWYEIVRTPIAKYLLAETRLFTDDYEGADAILYEIPDMFNFGEPEMEEHSNYIRFHNFKKQLQLENRSWSEIDDSEISYLQTIAEANTGRSSTMAKGVLCFFFNICYEDEIPEEIPEITPRMGSETPNYETIVNSEYGLTIYPNPAQTEITVSIGSEKVSIDKVELYDIFGKLLIKQNIYKSNGTIPINKVPDGIYVIKVFLSNGYVENLKVVKQQNKK